MSKWPGWTVRRMRETEVIVEFTNKIILDIILKFDRKTGAR